MNAPTKLQNLESLWLKFQNNPTELSGYEYSAIIDTAQHLYSTGTYSREQAASMINPVMDALTLLASQRHLVEKYSD